MTVINKDVTFLICLVCILTSCFVTRSKTKCILVAETNTIYGNEVDQKEFLIPKMFLPSIIENLYNRGTNSAMDYHDFWDKAEIKWVGYHIYGCRDTTWAKRTMADHLMKKYNIERFDSTYLDTVYRLEVIDEDKLARTSDSCIATIIKGDVIDGIPFDHYKCTPWGPVAQCILPYDSDTNSIDVDMREGHYDISVPREMDKELGVKYYSDTYLSGYGMTLSFARIDTIHLGVYRYKERKYGK